MMFCPGLFPHYSGKEPFVTTCKSKKENINQKKWVVATINLIQQPEEIFLKDT